MPDREKVISCLHCRAQDLMIDPPACDGCDYQIQMVNRMGCDFRRLCRDAIAILQEQDNEAKRIMKVIWDTLHEGVSIDTVPDQDWVYELIRHRIEDR